MIILNMENYDNYLTKFKKQLWDLCIKNSIFNNIPDSSLDKVKEIFEHTISNYKTQILQNDDNKSITSILINKINTEVSNLRSMKTIITKEEIQQQSKDHFNEMVEAKQNEFNQLMKKENPETPNFSDNKEAPINHEQFEQLINQQLQQRKEGIDINNNTNHIIENNSFSSLPNQSSLKTSDNKDIIYIKEKIHNLDRNIEKISIILQKIINSQIALLKK